MIRKRLFLSILIAGAIVLHIIEFSLPTFLFFPGAKLGLANIITLLVLVVYGFWSGIQVLLLRILISSLLIGTIFTPGFWLSLTGGLVSFLVMGYAYYHTDLYSVIGVSILGATFHNLGQIFMAYLLIGSWRVIIYLPYLLLLSLPTGIFVGIIVLNLKKHLSNTENIVFYNENS
ncbi:putative membrane protein [Halobacteroides halobius DSM 5150]|uniref:Putative membrane protein n=1 Tax=Halobacteroides halobius (strain ATCC 35273 / DSM 5150 / MD-1) TaxID=748449 RepID=L0K9E0_HALHC|nr:Gx transporter family protein [Halobacteroides halobius]AGB41897.1 putative membrane protein [Halobacteroides halobius DSM 5150]